jgi:hypothetical protein
MIRITQSRSALIIVALVAAIARYMLRGSGLHLESEARAAQGESTTRAKSTGAQNATVAPARRD